MTHKELMSLLTPEKAYERIIERGEAIIKAFPRMIYEKGSTYKIIQDKNRIYSYINTSEDGFFHYFLAQDNAEMILTKFSDDLEKLN